MQAGAQLPQGPPSGAQGQALNQLKNRRKIRRLHKTDDSTVEFAGRELSLAQLVVMVLGVMIIGVLGYILVVREMHDQPSRRPKLKHQEV